MTNRRANIDRINYNLSKKYYTSSSHALDIKTRTVPAFRPKPAPSPLPQPVLVPEPAAVTVIRTKMRLSLLTYIMVAVIAACAFSSVYYRATVQANHREVKLVENERLELSRQTAAARSVLSESYNLAEVEAMAAEFGLTKPAPHQEIRVYVNRD
jgi:hypothetical protein